MTGNVDRPAGLLLVVVALAALVLGVLSVVVQDQTRRRADAMRDARRRHPSYEGLRVVEGRRGE